MPLPRRGESQSGFISRCMSSKETRNSFPDQKQRVAFCHSQWRNRNKGSRNVKDNMDQKDLIQLIDDIIQDIAVDERMAADEKAGYPPNCNPGYVEKDGKCVPQETRPE